MEGYIKLWRTIRENRIWKKKPFSSGQAWVDLLMAAAWRDHPVWYQANVIELGRGQLATSQRQLAREWGWSRNRIKTFLVSLQKWAMITTTNEPGYMIVSICNYGLYQDNDFELGHKHYQERATEEPPMSHARATTEEEIRRDKKGEKSGPPKKSDDDPEILKTVAAFAFCKTPGDEAKLSAIEDLERQGVSHERMRAAAGANKKSDFYAIVKLLRNGKAVTPFIAEPSKAGKKPFIPKEEVDRKREEARAKAVEKLKVLPPDELARWKEELNAEVTRIPSYARTGYVENGLVLRAAKKFGIEGL